MTIRRIGAAVVVAALVSFPLVACGSGVAPTVTTVTATPTTSLAPCPPVGDPAWEKCFDAHHAQRERDAAAAKQQPSAPAKSTSSGLPWWSWLLIVPAALVAVGVLGIKVMERNDERTISRAQARVDELESRPRPVLDYDEWMDDQDEELDELPEEDMDFLHKVTDPVPAPAAPAPPAAGNLLSSLRNQGGAQ